MKYRKLPVVVEAEQFFDGQPLPFAADGTGNPVVSFSEVHNSHYVITAHAQRAYLANGDWVILESAGGGLAYPCKPAVFEATYEQAD